MRPKEKNKLISVFLSYAIEDIEYAHKLERILSQYPNVRIFSPATLSAGEPWASKLKDEISRCDIFFLILSPNSVDSRWTLQELGAAWALEKLVVPVLTHPKILSKLPVKLRMIKSVLFAELEKREVIDQILKRFEESTASHASG
jgi:hypothetical protein